MSMFHRIQAKLCRAMRFLVPLSPQPPYGRSDLVSVEPPNVLLSSLDQSLLDPGNSVDSSPRTPWIQPMQGHLIQGDLQPRTPIQGEDGVIYPPPQFPNPQSWLRLVLRYGTVSLGVTLAIVLVRWTGALQNLEFWSLDQLIIQGESYRPSRKILLVTIDETDISTLGQYPISDALLSQTIELLAAAQPTAIGLNLYRNVPIEPGYQEFLRVITNTPNLVAVSTLSNPSQNLNITPPFGLSNQQVGLADLLVDHDGLVRRAFLAYPVQSSHTPTGEITYSFVLRLALLDLKAQNIQPERLVDHSIQWGQGRLRPIQPNSGGYIRLPRGGFQILLRRWHKLEEFSQISLRQLLLQGPDPAEITNRIVLIGTIAQDYGSFFYVPQSRKNKPLQGISGLAVQANILNQLLATLDGQDPLGTWPQWGEWLWLFLWSTLGCGLYQGGRVYLQAWQPHQNSHFCVQVLWILLGLGGLGVGLGGGLTLVAFNGGLWLPWVPSLLTLGGTVLTLSIQDIWQNQRRNMVLLTHYNQTLAAQVYQRTAALLESEQDLALAQEQAHLGSWKFTVATGQMIWSAELFRIFGLDLRSEAPPLSFILDHIGSGDQLLYQTHWHRLISQGESFVLEHEIVRVDHRSCHVESRGAAQMNDQGEVVCLWGSFLDISHRKQAELALAAAEARWRSLVQQAPGFIFTFNSEGQVLYLNQSNDFLVVDSILGKPLDAWIRDGREAHQQALASVFQGQEPPAYEVRFQSAGGSNARSAGVKDSASHHHWYDLKLGPIVHDGATIAAIGIATDISDRKASELALRRSQNRLKALITNIKASELALRRSQNRLKTIITNVADGIVILNEQGVIEFVNPAAAKLLGRPTAELLNNFEWGLPIGAEAEMDLVDLQGNLRSIESRLADTDWNGKPAYIMTLRDITDRKTAEEELRCNLQQQQLLVRVVERMRQTLEINQIFKTTVEELRQILGCHRTVIYQFAMDWSGKVVAESVGRGWVSLMEDSPEVLTTLQEQPLDGDRCIVRRLENPQDISPPAPKSPIPKERFYFLKDTYLQQNQGGCFNISYPMALPVEDIEAEDFNPCYLDILRQIQARAYVIAPIFQGKKLWGLLAAYHNSHPRIWHHSELNMMVQIANQLAVAVQQAQLLEKLQHQTLELRLARDSAQSASRAKGNFLAHMSHELRTPLNAIQGFSRLLQLEGTLTPSQTENVATILRCSEHLLALINDILDISKMEAGRISLKLDDFNLHNLLMELGEMFRWKAQEKDIQYQVTWEPTLPRLVRSDRLRLRQILINLLSNAIKFTNQGQVTLQASVLPPKPLQDAPSSPNAQPCTLRFEVHDTGPGMSPEELALLFQPFIQTQAGQQLQEGTGLGLAISQGYAQLLGGTLSVRSQPQQGSCFSLTLTLDALDREVLNQDDTDAEPGDLGKYRSKDDPQSQGVVVVQDHPATSSAIRDSLAKLPQDWRQNLVEALLDLDDAHCQTLLDQVSSDQPQLVMLLRSFLEKFQYERILHLLNHTPNP